MRVAAPLQKTYGFWAVIGKPNGEIHARVRCRCTCGLEKLVYVVHLRAGTSSACNSCARNPDVTRVAVLHHGRLVEVGPAKTLCTQPSHDYTRQLVAIAMGHQSPVETGVPVAATA